MNSSKFFLTFKSFKSSGLTLIEQTQPCTCLWGYAYLFHIIETARSPNFDKLSCYQFKYLQLSFCLSFSDNCSVIKPTAIGNQALAKRLANCLLFKISLSVKYEWRISQSELNNMIILRFTELFQSRAVQFIKLIINVDHKCVQRRESPSPCL